MRTDCFFTQMFIVWMLPSHLSLWKLSTILRNFTWLLKKISLGPRHITINFHSELVIFTIWMLYVCAHTIEWLCVHTNRKSKQVLIRAMSDVSMWKPLSQPSHSRNYFHHGQNKIAAFHPILVYISIIINYFNLKWMKNG